MFTAHAPRNVIEGERRKRHKRRRKDGRDDVSVTRGLAYTACAFPLCDLGQRGGNNAKAKRRDQASVHSKAQSGCDTARQYNRFVEKPVHTGIVRDAARGGGAARGNRDILPARQSGVDCSRERGFRLRPLALVTKLTGARRRLLR